MRRLTVFAPHTLPEIAPGDDLARMISAALEEEGERLEAGDIVAVAHKVVSKSEGRTVRLADVCPGGQALRYAGLTGKSPALVEVILSESTEVMRWAPGGPLICRHRLGFACANAGVDESNCAPGTAVLLPQNPDESAARLRAGLGEYWGALPGVLVCDTHGRPFREGSCGIVVGAAGVAMLRSYIGRRDRDGRTLKSTREAVADELAAAATLAMGQGDESLPVAVIRGCADLLGGGRARDLLRPKKQDLFLKP